MAVLSGEPIRATAGEFGGAIAQNLIRWCRRRPREGACAPLGGGAGDRLTRRGAGRTDAAAAQVGAPAKDAADGGVSAGPALG